MRCICRWLAKNDGFFKNEGACSFKVKLPGCWVLRVALLMMKSSYLCCSAVEVKDHAFFKGFDWTQAYLQKYPPPLTPPRGK